MALYTDSDAITMDDLLQFESSLVQVSTSHGIDIQTKIKITTDSIGDKLLLGLQRAGRYNPAFTAFNSIGLDSVVITPALHRWLCFDALSRVFAEAYNVQLNTRFHGKLTEYQTEAQQAASLVFAGGLSIVTKPLPRPSMPSLLVGQGTITAPAVFVQATWVDSQGRESAPSPINAAVLNGFASVSVSIMPTPGQIPAAAVGWNLYAALTQGALTLQSTTPLATSASWQMPAQGLIGGVGPKGGQAPDAIVSLASRILRG
jgi:hypothetical protein